MIRCNCCGKELPLGGLKYIIEIKSFADFDGYLDDFPGDLEEGINDILDSIEDMESSTLEDEVYQELVFILCRECREKFTKNPFSQGQSPYLEQGDNKGTVH